MDDKLGPPPSYADSTALTQRLPPGQVSYTPPLTQQPPPYMEEQPQQQQAPPFHHQQQYSQYSPPEQVELMKQYSGQQSYSPRLTEQPTSCTPEQSRRQKTFQQQQHIPNVPPEQVQLMELYSSTQQFPQQYSASNAIVVLAQQPGMVQQMPINVESYFVLSWFACLCCCWPLGLAAIKKSSEVVSALEIGDYDKAQRASKKARLYAIFAIACGLLILPIIIGLRVSSF